MTGVTPVPPLRMTVPVWVPGAKAPVVACKVTVPLPVPVPAERVNQPVFSLARPVEGAAAGVAELSVCAAGLLPPSNRGEREARGDSPIMAGGTRCGRDGEGHRDCDRG